MYREDAKSLLSKIVFFVCETGGGKGVGNSGFCGTEGENCVV